ncbi:hypothetical protein BaRGS_00019362 [Batillaria attramentaria]|uniref:Uncharacterized protein n=1 Tax=Batillaria attramentaria TaxID=370345 RepID=A0ABD0KR81_9CAEN
MDQSPSPRKTDPQKPAANPSDTLQVPPHKPRSQSRHSAASVHTSFSQSKSRASTRQSGLTNISNWTALSAMSNTSVKSSFYPSSGYPTTNPLAGAGYPTSGYPVSGLPGGTGLGYPGTSFGYPASNYPGFPNFPCCDVPGATSIQPYYPNSEFPTSAFPGEIEQEEECQPYIGMHDLVADMPGAFVPDQYGGGYPTEDLQYGTDMANGFPVYGSQTYSMPYQR